MKKILFCMVLVLASTAQAGLIITNTTTDLTAFGFGTAPSILTLQATTYEQGCVIPTSPSPNYSTSTCGLTGTGLVAGNNKYAAPSLFDLGVTSYANLALLFNTNETGSNIQLTLRDLVLTLYNPTTLASVNTFGLLNETGSGVTDLTVIAQGQGSAGFVIRISPQEIATAGAFDPSLRVGLMAKVGCTLLAANCDGTHQLATDDGAESFTIVNLAGPQQVVPEPATAVLLGGGLIALAWTLRRRRAS